MSNQHRARKRFGQNFLTDRQIIARIVESIAAKPGEKLVEIGPGKGALTEQLLAQTDHLTAIELDRDLVTLLERRQAEWTRAGTHFDIISADALSFDFADLATNLGQPLRVVGNLPYNISSPLLFHLLKVAPHITDMHFMLQREVVERMAATPGNKRFGRLSVMVQWQCTARALFTVPPTAFTPQPKVESAIVRLTPRALDEATRSLAPIMLQVVTAAFSQRRKTLRNSLSQIISAEALQQLDIDAGARAEVLNVSDYQRIAQSLTQTSS